MVRPIINCPGKITKSQYSSRANKLKAYYGLDPNIKFCQACTYSNQKPNSEKEYKHEIKTKKPSLKLNKNNICNACYIQKFKTLTDRIISPEESKRFLNNVQNLRKLKSGSLIKLNVEVKQKSLRTISKKTIF